MPVTTSLLHIPAAPNAAPLSPAQKKFNTQVRTLEQLRHQLADWELALQAYRQRHDAELRPLQHACLAQELALLQWLDAQSDRKGLTKAERQTLAESLAERAAELLGCPQNAAAKQATKELYQRHSGRDWDAGQANAPAATQEMAQSIFGTNLKDAPQDPWLQLEAQMEAARARAEAARAAHHAKRRRKPSAAEQKRRQAEAEAEASQSVRAVYRKLASSLHPDREPDPAERARKTVLMQRVNQAYAAGRLLELLQLQLEAEQIDAAHLQGLSDERLTHYNRVLAGQVAELRHEVRAQNDGFCQAFGHDPMRSYQPARIAALLAQQLRLLRAETTRQQHQLRWLRQDPAALETWLALERKRLQALARETAMGEPDDDLFF